MSQIRPFNFFLFLFFFHVVNNYILLVVIKIHGNINTPGRRFSLFSNQIYIRLCYAPTFRLYRYNEINNIQL